MEVRLELPDGLSFVERVGFRYCVDKVMRASAAAVYWRTIDRIHRQRLWMSSRLEELHQDDMKLVVLSGAPDGGGRAHGTRGRRITALRAS